MTSHLTDWIARLIAAGAKFVDRRSITTTLVLSLLSSALVFAAVQADGSAATNVRLDDGSVWVTNEARGRVGRLNVRIDELDFSRGAGAEDVLQDGRAVFFDGSDGSVQQIDPASAISQSVPELPLELYQLAGGIGLVHDPDSGGLWVGPSDALPAASYPEDPHAVLPESSLVHVTAGEGGHAGRVLVIDEDGWWELELDASMRPVYAAVEDTSDDSDAADDGDVGPPPLPTPDRRPLDVALSDIAAITSVGDEPVFLLGDGRVLVPGSSPVDVPGDDVVVQQTGPGASHVLTASTEGLFAIPMGGGTAELVVEGSGLPAAPVRVGPCLYGAWAGDEPSFARSCGGEVVARPVPRATPGMALVWRVNGLNIALNQPGDGGVWAHHDGELAFVGNWSDVEDDTADDSDDQQDGESDRTVEKTCIDGGNATPTAGDDTLGLRPRQTIVDVLYNDDDPNCEPIVITTVSPTAGPWGQLTIINNGQHLLFSPSDTIIRDAATARQAFTFTYVVADAMGNESGEADVAVSVYGREVANNPPELRVRADGSTRAMRTVVEEGRAIRYSVTADWWDPDGDDLQLQAAIPEGLGQATGTPDGTVRYAAYGVGPGVQRVAVTMTDGIDAATETLDITVKPAGSALPPVVQNDFITLVAGQTGTVYPLANDADPNESPLDINPLWLPFDGSEYRTRQEGNAVEITAVSAGTYRLDYEAVDGTDASQGAILLTVLDKSGSNRAPVAVPDTMRLRVDRVINVDVLANDVDADGDLLGVVSVDIGDATVAENYLRASVIDRRLVQVELVRGPDGEEPIGPFVINYTVSDGHGAERAADQDAAASEADAIAAQGTITVLVQPPTEDQAPIPEADRARVRTGDLVAVPVLRNDIDPDTDEITLDSIDEDGAASLEASGAGVAWVEGRDVWFQGGEPGRYSLLYTIEAGGKTATSEVVFDVTDPFDLDTNPNQLPAPPDLTLRALRNGTVRIKVPLTGVDPDGDSVALLDQISDHEGAITGNRVTLDPEEPGTLLFEAGPRSGPRDHFQYAVRDRFGGVGLANVDVLVLDDDGAPPVAHDDIVRARPGRTVTVPVLANDTSPQDRRLELAAEPFFDIEGQTTDQPVADGVTVLDQADPDQRGRIDVVVPDVGSAVNEHYRITDGINPADAYLRITPDPEAPNKPPVANLDEIDESETRGLDTFPVPVLDNDYDPDDARGVLALSIPAGQSARVSGSQVVVDLLERSRVVLYRIEDADGGVAVGRIAVPGKENHPPELSPEGKDRTQRTIEAGTAEPLVIELEDIVVDPDGDTDITLTDYEVRVLVEQGDIRRHDDNRGFTYTPPASLAQTTVIPIQFEVTDRPDRSLEEQLLPTCGCRAVLTVEAVIEAKSPPRVIAEGAIPVPQLDEPVEFDLAALVVDDQGDPLTFRLVDPDAGGLDLELAGSTLTIVNIDDSDTAQQLGRKIPIDFVVRDDNFDEDVEGRATVTIIRTNRAMPATASFGTQDAVRDENFELPNLLDSAFNPFASEGRSLELVRFSATRTATVDCTDTGDCTFFSDTVGGYTISYTIRDAAGRTANGSVPVVVKGVPRAPGVPRIESVGDHQVSLTWDAADMQGGRFEKYIVRTVSTGQSQEFTTTGGTFTGLTNGQQYRFTVTAVNELGEGETSGPSSAAIPDRVPSPPEALRFPDYQDSTLTLAWDPPSDASDYTAIKDYEVRIGGQTLRTGGDTSIVVSGLQNGTDYTFTVRAQNSATTDGGWGRTATSARTERPSRQPDPARNVQIVNAGDGGSPRVRVSWNPPAFDGGRPIQSYTVAITPSTGVSGSPTQTIPAGSNEATFTVTRNNDYRATVVATSSDKNDPDSDPAQSPVITAVGNPDPPNLIRVDSGDKTLTAVAHATNRSGCSTENLQYSRNNGSSWQSSPTFTGLTNGTAYTIVARAVLPSSCGTAGQTYQSGNSNAITQTPYGPLQQPTMNVSRNGNVITWSWSTNRRNDDGLDNLNWRASLSGECAGRTAHPSGSYSRDYGYSSGTRTCTITVSADGRTSKTASASASTPPPPPPPSISTSKGAAYDGRYGSCSGCNYVHVSGANHPPNASVRVRCEGATPGTWTNWDNFSPTNGSGSFSEQAFCFHSATVTQEIHVQVNGVNYYTTSDW